MDLIPRAAKLATSCLGSLYIGCERERKGLLVEVGVEGRARRWEYSDGKPPLAAVEVGSACSMVLAVRGGGPEGVFIKADGVKPGVGVLEGPGVGRLANGGPFRN